MIYQELCIPALCIATSIRYLATAPATAEDPFFLSPAAGSEMGGGGGGNPASITPEQLPLLLPPPRQPRSRRARADVSPPAPRAAAP